jgi:squalene-associated FAD-dependent desaturase
MAAAVTLANRGVPVTVFESGPVPGGRARRVSTQGVELDNGQHILAGAYSQLFALMRQVGVANDALLRLPFELRYAKGFRLRALGLPSPLGLAAGLLVARGIPFAERLRAARFMNAMKKLNFRLDPDLAFEALLVRYGQAGKIGHYLWRPLCVSALNTPSGQASSNTFLAVLRDTLNGGAHASDLLLPRMDLSRLFPEPAATYVAERGGEIRLRTPVSDLGALKREFASVVVAVGPHQLKALGIDFNFTYQPIYTCYLQYPENVRMPFPMLGLAEGLVQWVFDRGALLGEKGRMACVISAQGDHQQLGQEELAERCHAELAAMVDELPRPDWTRIIAEKRATIASTVGLRKPLPRFAGVHLAGDYLDAEYPPTLEAAVRSGVRAALQVAQ